MANPKPKLYPKTSRMGAASNPSKTFNLWGCFFKEIFGGFSKGTSASRATSFTTWPWIPHIREKIPRLILIPLKIAINRALFCLLFEANLRGKFRQTGQAMPGQTHGDKAMEEVLKMGKYIRGELWGMDLQTERWLRHVEALSLSLSLSLCHILSVCVSLSLPLSIYSISNGVSTSTNIQIYTYVICTDIRIYIHMNIYTYLHRDIYTCTHT